MTREEKRTVLAVFTELLKMDYDKLNGFLGSLTIKEMQDLWHKLRYEDYCKKHGIDHRDMTDEDYIRAYEED